MQAKTIAFIGAGNMSRSIISGLIKQHYPASAIIAANPSQGKLDELNNEFAIQITNDNHQALQLADVVVLAVKPQLMEGVCQDLAASVADKPESLDNKLFITIAAGIPHSRYQDYFNRPISLVRTMPNSPSLLGLGMTGLYTPNETQADDRLTAEEIMRAVGEILWVQDDSMIDTVTAAAGSAPAYFFLLMEEMQQSAVKMGLTAEEARRLIQQTALGAAEMVRHNGHLELPELRAQVTSKGGTTAAALAQFQQADLAGTVDNAMNAAVDRAREMAKLF